MPHDWIIEVLTDLRHYAQSNGLPDTAEGAEVLLRLVRAEVAALAPDGAAEGDEATGPGGLPPRSLPH